VVASATSASPQHRTDERYGTSSDAYDGKTFATSSVRPPHVEVKSASPISPPNVRTSPAVSAIARSVSGCSTPTPPYAWQRGVAQRSYPSAAKSPRRRSAYERAAIVCAFSASSSS
jgi:hypothetical protein